MIDRKTESERLIIFLVITFAITWGLFFFPYIYADNTWGVSQNSAGDVDSLVSLAMLIPTLGMLLTRYIRLVFGRPPVRVGSCTPCRA